MKQDTDFEILREYGEAIKDKPWREMVKAGGIHPDDLPDFKATSLPYLNRLIQNMGHDKDTALSLLRAVL